ncbi:MAG: hypothetical protein IIT53_13510 [Fibrobacter sp.]|nr:hypothetical protein [Fibrobacter sp.]
MKEDEKRYKRDFLRTIILLKEITFFSDHLFKGSIVSNDTATMLRKHIDNQIYLKYDFIPLNLLKESLPSFKIYCKENPELGAQYKKLNKDLEFINHLRNKVSGHLSDEALDKMIQWNPDIYNEYSIKNSVHQEYQIYRGMLEIAINSYLDEDEMQKQFGMKIDIQIPNDRKIFYDYLLDSINTSISFLKNIQNIIRPNIKYIKFAQSSISKNEQSEYLDEISRIIQEIKKDLTKGEILLPKIYDIIEKFGINPEPYREAGKTDFRFKPRGR